MKAKIGSVLRLALPYIIIALLPIISVIVLSGYIMKSHTEKAISDRNAAIAVAVDRVDQKIRSVVELSYLIAGNDQVLEYVINGISGQENSMEACDDIQDLLSGIAKNEQIAEIYFYDAYTGRIIASDTHLDAAWMFFTYEYQPDNCTPEQAMERLQASTRGYGYGYSDAHIVTIDNKRTQVIEYRISVPVDRYGQNQSQLIISLDVEKLFEDLFDEMDTGAEFYIYNADRLIYSSGTTYADKKDVQMQQTLQPLQEDLYAAQLLCNDEVWRVQVFYPELEQNARELSFTGSMLLAVMAPMVLCVAVCIYFTHRNHREISGIVALFRGEDVPAEELEKDRYMDYDLVRSFAGYVIEKNTVYRTQLREISASRKGRVLEGLLRNAYPGRKEKQAALAAVELQLGDAPCAVLCIQSDDIGNENYTIDDITVRDKIVEHLQTNVGSPMELVNDLYAEIVCILAVDENFDDLVDQVISELNVQFKYKYGVDLKMGVGNPVNTLCDIHTSYEQAKEVIRYSESTGSNIRVYEQVSSQDEVIFYPVQTDDKISNYLIAGHAQEVKNVIEQIYSENFRESNRIVSREMIDMVKYRITNAVMSVAEKHGVTFTDEHKRFLKEKNLQKYFVALMELVDVSVNEIASKKNSAQNVLANKIREYVQEHYMDRGLSIKQIANVFHFHENYISNLYKEECGENLSTAIERIRIEKACALLKATDVKVSEIAAAVGYASDSSFRRAFKKIMGVSPLDFRNYQGE